MSHDAKKTETPRAPRAPRAADPTALAKKAAAKVRRCAEELTTALAVAHDGGLVVGLAVMAGDSAESANVHDVRTLTVIEINAQVAL